MLAHVPPAPKFREEIKEIIDEGLVSDSGCMVIEAYGKKDGKDVLVETHVFAPELVESYEKAGNHSGNVFDRARRLSVYKIVC